MKKIPWWFHILLAIISYHCFKYLVPQIQFSSQSLQRLAQAAPGIAPLAAIIFLLLAAAGLYESGDKTKTSEGDSKEE